MPEHVILITTCDRCRARYERSATVRTMGEASRTLAAGWVQFHVPDAVVTLCQQCRADLHAWLEEPPSATPATRCDT
jgi:hypothetical protein